MILDMTDDNGKYLDSLFDGAGKPDKPDFMKTASFKASTGPGASPYDSDYALAVTTPDGALRRFPLMTKSAALASAAYLTRYADAGLPEDLAKSAAKKLVAALDSYGVPVEGRLSELAKEACETDENVRTYFDSQAWSMHENPSASLTDLWSMDGWEPLNGEKGLSPRGMGRMWAQIKEAGLAVPEEALDYASTEFGSDLQLCIDARKTCVPDDSTKAELDAIMKTASTGTVSEVVDALEQFDIDNQIQHLWGKYFPDPYVSVVGTSIDKTASEGLRISVGGREMSHDELNSAVSSNIDAVKAKFGSSISDELEKDPVGVYNSLPMDFKDALGNVLV